MNHYILEGTATLFIDHIIILSCRWSGFWLVGCEQFSGIRYCRSRIVHSSMGKEQRNANVWRWKRRSRKRNGEGSRPWPWVSSHGCHLWFQGPANGGMLDHVSRSSLYSHLNAFMSQTCTTVYDKTMRCHIPNKNRLICLRKIKQNLWCVNCTHLKCTLP